MRKTFDDPGTVALVNAEGSETSQAHLALLRSREALVGTRTKLVNHVRGAVKPFGICLPKCSPESFHHKVRDSLPEALFPALAPVLETIAH